MAISSDLSLPVVLRRIVAAACELVDARYGALGVIGPGEGGLERGLVEFITVGADEETIKGIGPYPQGRGILGLLITDPQPLRLRNLQDHVWVAGTSTQPRHLALDVGRCDRALSEGDPCMHHQPDAPAGQHEARPEEAMPRQRPDADHHRVDDHIADHMGDEVTTLLEATHRASAKVLVRVTHGWHLQRMAGPAAPSPYRSSAPGAQRPNVPRRGFGPPEQTRVTKVPSEGPWPALPDYEPRTKLLTFGTRRITSTQPPSVTTRGHPPGDTEVFERLVTLQADVDRCEAETIASYCAKVPITRFRAFSRIVDDARRTADARARLEMALAQQRRPRDVRTATGQGVRPWDCAATPQR